MRIRTRYDQQWRERNRGRNWKYSAEQRRQLKVERCKRFGRGSSHDAVGQGLTQYVEAMSVVRYLDDGELHDLQDTDDADDEDSSNNDACPPTAAYVKTRLADQRKELQEAQRRASLSVLDPKGDHMAKISRNKLDQGLRGLVDELESWAHQRADTTSRSELITSMSSRELSENNKRLSKYTNNRLYQYTKQDLT